MKSKTTSLKAWPPVNKKPTTCKRCGVGDRSYSTRINGAGKRYYHLVCTKCRKNDARRARRKRLSEMDPISAYRIRRHDQLRNRYGISLAEYEELLENQGGVCAICQQRKGKYNMPLDHCHKTGKNRGVLCHYCNKGLGHFYDSPELLASAIEYLKVWA